MQNLLQYGIHPASGKVVYQSGEVHSVMKASDAAMAGSALGLLEMDVRTPADTELWIVDKNPAHPGIRTDIRSSVEEYNSSFFCEKNYVPIGASITRNRDEASVSAAAEAEIGIFTCEVKSGGTGRATVIAAQYVDGRMVDLRISDVVIDLGVGGKVSFSFKPADGAEYKAYLLYEGAMIPVC